MLAVRFQQQPIRPPSYQFKEVPAPDRGSLRSSVVFDVPDGHRKYMVDSMGEMVLLCNEVMKRQRGAGCPPADASVVKATKPLSLEYIADRLDVGESH